METLMYTSTHSHPSKHIHGQHTHSCAHTLTPIQTHTWTTRTLNMFFCSWTFPHLKIENGTVVRLQSEKAKAASTYKLHHVDMFVFQCWESNKCVTCPPHGSSSECQSSIPITVHGKLLLLWESSWAPCPWEVFLSLSVCLKKHSPILCYGPIFKCPL